MAKTTLVTTKILPPFKPASPSSLSERRRCASHCSWSDWGDKSTEKAWKLWPSNLRGNFSIAPHHQNSSNSIARSAPHFKTSTRCATILPLRNSTDWNASFPSRFGKAKRARLFHTHTRFPVCLAADNRVQPRKLSMRKTCHRENRSPFFQFFYLCSYFLDSCLEFRICFCG